MTISRSGERMTDGNPVPRNLDGMSAFAWGGLVRLVRNHEDRNSPGFGTVRGPLDTKDDPMGGGGTVTIDFDPVRGVMVRDFVSLNGTIVNRAGGRGWRYRSWLTCEETTADAGSGDPPGWGRDHGYVFETPLNVFPAHPAEATPYPAHGPVRPRGRCGRPADGSRLPHRGRRLRLRHGRRAEGCIGVLPVRPRQFEGLRSWRTPPDARHPPAPSLRLHEGPARRPSPPGRVVDIPEPDPAPAGPTSPDKVVAQGWEAGGAIFTAGQPPTRPRDRGRQPPDRPGASGRSFEFAVNILNDSEFAGVCFSPDGTVLFVNVFGTGDDNAPGDPGSGMTCAVTGPWRRGPL